MRELQQEYKFNNKLVLNPDKNIPDALSSKDHNQLCSASTSSDPCSYTTGLHFEKAIDLLHYIVQNWERQNVFDVFNNKQNVDKLLFHILMYDVTIKQRKHINRLLRINNTPGQKLESSFLKKICYFAMKVSKLKFCSDQSPKYIYISDFRSSPLKAFTKGFLAKSLHKRNAEEISLSRFLCDTGSDTNILNYETFRQMGFKDSNLTKCGPITLKGSAGSLDNSFLGYFTSYIFLQGTDNSFYHIQQTFYLINPNLKIPNILGQPFLLESNCNL